MLSSASSSPCGMLNGLWLKSILPVPSFLIHREINDPAELEASIFVDQLQLDAHLVAHGTAEGLGAQGFPQVKAASPSSGPAADGLLLSALPRCCWQAGPYQRHLSRKYIPDLAYLASSPSCPCDHRSYAIPFGAGHAMTLKPCSEIRRARS